MLKRSMLDVKAWGRLWSGCIGVLLLLVLLGQTLGATVPRFEVTLAPGLVAEPVQGRLLLLISNRETPEPRYLVGEYQFLSSQLVFGVDVSEMKPGVSVPISGDTFGYPLQRLDRVPPGDYQVQVVFHRYERVTREDGHTVLLPWDRGEGQRWDLAPGNLFCASRTVAITAEPTAPVRIQLDRMMPPLPEPVDTPYIKHIRLKSEKLSHFWGRPVYLGAVVILPRGWAEHPKARYPLVIKHDHFAPTFARFKEESPGAEISGPQRQILQRAHDLYRLWTGPDFPRVILAFIQHPTPYYDDSYGVNSPNNGPYGDAIAQELVPHIEQRFRGLGAGWARTLYGSSTGGWTALATQVFYPDGYNGCWAACPDSVDFRSHILVNIYREGNMYYRQGPWMRFPIAGACDGAGNMISTIEAQNHRELAFATRGRSGFQWDGWDAAFGPVAKDGYPRPLFDKRTGVIDSQVALWWREHADLSHILQRDWARIGASLRGKIHVYVGDRDTYFLQNPVYLLEEVCRSLDPLAEAEFHYGKDFGHCWSGHPEAPGQKDTCPDDAAFFIPLMVRHLRETAPKGADLQSWDY